MIGHSLSAGMNFFRLSNGGICSLSPCSADDPRDGAVPPAEPVCRRAPTVRAFHMDAVPQASRRGHPWRKMKPCRRPHFANATRTELRGTRCERVPAARPIAAVGPDERRKHAAGACESANAGSREATRWSSSFHWSHFSHWLQHIQPSISGIPCSSASSTMCSLEIFDSQRSMLSPEVFHVAQDVRLRARIIPIQQVGRVVSAAHQEVSTVDLGDRNFRPCRVSGNCSSDRGAG